MTARDAPVGTVWFGGPVDSASISLRIVGTDLEPSEITFLLGCEPTACARTGAMLTRPDGRSRVVKTGFWQLGVERNALHLAEQIDSLLGRLTGDLSVWRSVTERFEVDLFCGLFLETTNRGLEIPAEVLRALGERGITLGFDIYAP